jgi:hypothetical protein
MARTLKAIKSVIQDAGRHLTATQHARLRSRQASATTQLAVSV